METTRARLCQIVRFELPAYADVDGFCDRIRPQWPGSARLRDDVWRVSAILADDCELPVLLRTVEAYVREAELGAIRYWVDGRFYVLEGRLPTVVAQRL